MTHPTDRDGNEFAASIADVEFLGDSFTVVRGATADDVAAWAFAFVMVEEGDLRVCQMIDGTWVAAMLDHDDMTASAWSSIEAVTALAAKYLGARPRSA